MDDKQIVLEVGSDRELDDSTRSLLEELLNDGWKIVQVSIERRQKRLVLERAA
jgi:tRNA threonylcarbamoyladenosine modification (KEOPS) complex  Pcc1 subunit